MGEDALMFGAEGPTVERGPLMLGIRGPSEWGPLMFKVQGRTAFGGWALIFGVEGPIVEGGPLVFEGP